MYDSDRPLDSEHTPGSVEPTPVPEPVTAPLPPISVSAPPAPPTVTPTVPAAVGPEGPRDYLFPDPSRPEDSAARMQERVDAAAPTGVPAPVGAPPRGRFGATLAAGLIGGVLGAVLMGGGLVWIAGGPSAFMAGQKAATSQPTSTKLGTTTPATTVADNDTKLAEPVVSVAEKVNPSVVNVAISQSAVNPFTGQRSTSAVGNGSGIIIRSDGYILTNNHVVENADKITVRIGSKDMTATVVGTDSSTDLAVIKVAATGLQAATLGDSAILKVGEPVVAIGSPFGLDKTVTSGIVSALGRTTVQETQTNITAYTNLIQTDAAINPGNSGGALVNMNGEVIGINALIQSPSGSVGAAQSAGIGFAIPMNSAKQVADEIIKTGKATHACLGVSTISIDAGVAQQFKLTSTTGALVQFVQPASPAAKGGLKRDDVILKIGDTDITSYEDVFTAVRGRKVGDVVKVLVIRAGKDVTLSVTLGSDATK